MGKSSVLYLPKLWKNINWNSLKTTFLGQKYSKFRPNVWIDVIYNVKGIFALKQDNYIHSLKQKNRSSSSFIIADFEQLLAHKDLQYFNPASVLRFSLLPYYRRNSPKKVSINTTLREIWIIHKRKALLTNHLTFLWEEQNCWHRHPHNIRNGERKIMQTAGIKCWPPPWIGQSNYNPRHIFRTF